jgi:hypothetical protein
MVCHPSYQCFARAPFDPPPMHIYPTTQFERKKKGIKETFLRNPSQGLQAKRSSKADSIVI